MMFITGENSKVAQIGFTYKLLTEIKNFSIKKLKISNFFYLFGNKYGCRKTENICKIFLTQ